MAKLAEDDGYDGLWCPETGHDPFISLALAAQATDRVQLGTGIAVAFARNPMTMATLANDLQLLSGGRFMLGLGSQIKPHIEKRYSMVWSHPAARMREFVAAMQAIWSAWNDGTRLAFRGDFYKHTLMTPFFSPGPNLFGPPKVFVAAVGQLMTEVVGEVADGLLVHGFTTERYLREVSLPALDRGLEKSGRSRSAVEISYPGMVVTGDTEEQMATAARAVRSQIALYGSPPAYQGVLDLHGWGELHNELNVLSKRGAWDEMADLIDDDVLDAFAVVAEPDKVPAKVLERFGNVVNRFSFYAPYAMERDRWQSLVAGFR